MPPIGRTRKAAAKVPKEAISCAVLRRFSWLWSMKRLASTDNHRQIAVHAEVEPLHRVTQRGSANGAFQQLIIDDRDVFDGQFTGRCGRIRVVR